MRIALAALLAVALFVADAQPIGEPAPLFVQTPPIQIDQPPVPERPTSITGVATWFDARRNGQSSWYTRKGITFYAAAGPAVRALLGKPNGHFYRVEIPLRVCATLTGKCITVILTDWCSCHKGHPTAEKAIDLAPAAFKALGIPLSRGIAQVTVERIP